MAPRSVLGFCASCVVLLLTACTPQPVLLATRLEQFPNLNQPSYGLETPDLYYPAWLLGTWNLKSTLTALEAPLGIEFTNATSFAKNQRDIGKPITYPVRFIRNEEGQIIADRAFNTLALSDALLGTKVVQTVLVPSPNRQIILLEGNRRGELFITRRHSDPPQENGFGTLEFYRQVLSSVRTVPNTRDIEVTTVYTRTSQGLSADQMTAVFLVPTDERYFQSQGRAVTVYRYRMEFTPSR